MTSIRIINVDSVTEPDPPTDNQSVVKIESIWNGTGSAADVPIASGICKMTVGLHDALVKGDEIATVVEGALTVADRGSGETLPLKAGDAMFLAKGTEVSWSVSEPATIVYMMVG
jgi:uncharacterized cupin superfamily protein